MSNHARYLTFLGSLFLGIASGFLLLSLFGRLSLPPQSTIYRIFGIKKSQIIGFQPFWLLKRAQERYSQITTFAYFALTLDSDGTILKLVNPQEEEPGWTWLKGELLGERLHEVKKQRQKLSLVMHMNREASISALLEKPQEHARNLIADVVPIMQEHGFSDLNLDIESFKEASESAQRRYTAFVRAVKKGLEEKGLGTLTVEVTPSSPIKNRLTDVAAIGEIADYVVLMAYDFHYNRSFLAGPVAPIGGLGTVREYDVESALTETLALVPKEKVILGIPLYGYEWETVSERPGSATIPGGGSTASNRRVEDFLSECDDCRRRYDDASQQPSIVFSYENYFHQIFYEDVDSIQKKLELAQRYGIGGVALWALGYEGEKILVPVSAYRRGFDWVK